MRFNWCTGSGKSAFRFDGDDKTGTSNGEMSFNVVWNNSGLSVKGNHQSAPHPFTTAFRRTLLTSHNNPS